MMWTYLRWLGLPLALVFKGIVWVRHWLYNQGILPTHRLPVPVISVGNIQLGGTGKTPLVLALLEWLQQHGYVVGVLTRGYRRRKQEDVVIMANEAHQSPIAVLGDEPSLIWQALKSGAIGVGRHRARVARQLLKRTAVDVIVLDDGLQHRALHRDVDICLIDVSRWQYPGLLFPVSYLRDVLPVLRGVTAIVLTKWEFQEERLAGVTATLRRYTSAPIFKGRYQATGLRHLITGQLLPLSQLQDQPVLAVSGIANPYHFEQSLTASGIKVEATRRFKDHHQYVAKDIQQVVQFAKKEGLTHIVTTEKDAVKWANMQEQMETTLNWWVLLMRLEVTPPAEWEQFWKQWCQKLCNHPGTSQ